MPLKNPRNLSLTFGKSAKGTTASSSIVENLKLQHAEELARASEEHAKEVEALENEVAQYQSEVSTLRSLSDEHTDKFMPLSSPYKSLKFVRNTTVKKPRNKGVALDKNAANMIADLKTKHNKELARAAETYARKLQVLKREVDRFKAETEVLKASSSGIRDGVRSCDGDGVNLKTGVAAYDKENVARNNGVSPNIPASVLEKKPRQSGDLKTNGESDSLDELGSELGNLSLRNQYERLFRDDYRFEKDAVAEQALALESDYVDKHVDIDEIDELCEDLATFMADIRLRDVKVKR